MTLTGSNPAVNWRTLLVLGRVSNLPTVWSNCLAGWWLGGGGHVAKLLLLCLGATCVYLGGMFLNDACDAQFDAMYRRERPIPAGWIEPQTVWGWSLGWLSLGTLLLVSLGQGASHLTLALVGCVVLYDFTHKFITFSPGLMAACRFLLYLLAASTAAEGITGLAIWSSLALAAYILGLSYLARKESARGMLRSWPGYLLALPIVLALIVNDGESRPAGVLFSVVFAAWLIRCLRHTFWTSARNVSYTVSGLLAGIVLVDLLAVVNVPAAFGSLFVLLFLTALVFQRFIPAT